MTKRLIAAGILSLLLIASIGIGAAAVSLPFSETVAVDDPQNDTVVVDVEFNETDLSSLTNSTENVTVSLSNTSGTQIATQSLTGNTSATLQTAEFGSADLSETGNHMVNVSTQLSDGSTSAVEEIYISVDDGSSSGALIGLEDASAGTWILLAGAGALGWIWYRESDYEI